jgi:ABC-type spermidine/putrescine transport system permease subunit II
LFSPRRLTDMAMHGYVLAWLLIFVLPFLALLDYSMQKGRGYDPLGNYGYVFFGTFKNNLLLSLQVTLSAIVLNTLIAIPAAYGIVRFSFPGKRAILSLLNLPLYTPSAVMGLGLLLVYNLVYHIQQSTFGLIAAMTMGTFGLALMPIIVALKDLPPALAVAMQAISFVLIVLFFRIVGSRYLRGTYLM